MIELHYIPDDKRSNNLLEEVDRMVLSVKRVSSNNSEFSEQQLPLFKEHEAIYSTEEDIQVFLYELKHQLNVERTVSGDSCSIDPVTGEKC